MKARNLLAVAISSLVFPLAQAAGTDTTRLETELTDAGAERAGNASGTIPAWTGGMEPGAAPVEANGNYQNPFADERPLYVITAQNYQEYADVLTPGQIQRFKVYADFRMPVYPSHRSSRLPERYNQQARDNVGKVTLSEDGQGLSNYHFGIPFIMPETPMEVLWNHLARFRGGSIDREFSSATVTRSGTASVLTYTQWLAWRENFTDLPDGDQRLFNTLLTTTAPARYAGNVLLVQDSLNYAADPRVAWQYNPGQRRARRAPTVAYDSSARFSNGLVTSDGVDGFQGSPDRYDWKLVGKQELLVGYNAYDLANRQVSYDSLLTANYINPDVTRYEPHRVWVLEANLKDNARHMYKTRRFYLDEDTWQIMVSDIYDGRDTLWRLYESHLKQMHDVETPITAIEVTHDLLAGEYATNYMINQSSEAPVFGKPAKVSDFTTTALRQAGR